MQVLQVLDALRQLVQVVELMDHPDQALRPSEPEFQAALSRAIALLQGAAR